MYLLCFILFSGHYTLPCASPLNYTTTTTIISHSQHQSEGNSEFSYQVPASKQLYTNTSQVSSFYHRNHSQVSTNKKESAGMLCNIPQSGSLLSEDDSCNEVSSCNSSRSVSSQVHNVSTLSAASDLSDQSSTYVDNLPHKQVSDFASQKVSHAHSDVPVGDLYDTVHTEEKTTLASGPYICLLFHIGYHLARFVFAYSVCWYIHVLTSLLRYSMFGICMQLIVVHAPYPCIVTTNSLVQESYIHALGRYKGSAMSKHRKENHKVQGKWNILHL